MSIPASIQEDARRIIERLPEALNIGPPQTHASLTVFPLSRGDAAGKTPYVTLDQALAAGTFRVTEVSTAGSVPELRVINEGNAHVLILDGEELVGAKQNRVLNVTVLVPPHQSIVVPVSCVEAGRWAQTGRQDFMAAKHMMYSKLRRSSYSDVLASSSAGRGYRSDQRKVWSSIAAKSERLGSSSNTRAMRDMFKDRERDIDRFVAAITAGDDQVGAAFCIGGALAGVELFDHPSTLVSLLPKLVRSYAMDAIELNAGTYAIPGVEAVKTFVNDIARANKEVRAGVGDGEDVRISAPTLVGGALVFESQIVHLSAFPLENEGGRDKSDDTPESTATEAPAQRSWLSSLRRRRNRRM